MLSSRSFNSVFLFIIFALVSVSSHAAVSLRCGFEYEGKAFEWVRAQSGEAFRYINDSGQAVLFRENAVYETIEFYDVGAYWGRQVVAGYQFDNEFEEYVVVEPFGINNDGQVFGYIFLANDFPDDFEYQGNDTFKEFSVGFSFYWEADTGFNDVSSIVAGITGRSDIGYETFFVPDYESGGSKLITNDNTYSDGSVEPQYSTPVPFPIRRKEQNISQVMLETIEAECGSSPVSNAADFLASGYDSNSNNEFINGRHLVRRARPQLQISASHYWTSYDAEGQPEFSRGETGNVTDQFGIQFDVNNNGAVDVYDVTASLEYDGQAEQMFDLSYLDADLGTIASQESSSNNGAYFNPIEPGTGWIRVKVTGKDSEGFDYDFYSTWRKLTVEGAAPTRIFADMSFSDGRSDHRVDLDKDFKIKLDVKTDGGEGGVDNINVITNFANASNLELVSEPEVPVGFSMAPNVTRTFEWTVKATEAGKWRIANTVTGIDTYEVAIDTFDAFEGGVRGAIGEVSFVFPEDGVQLEEADVDNEGLQPKRFPVRVSLKIPEDGDDLKDIKLGVGEDESPLRITKQRYVEETETWVDVARPVPFPVTIVSGPTPEQIATAEKGTEVFFDFEVEATDVGTFNFETLVEAVFTNEDGDDILVREASPKENRLTITGDVVLGIHLEISGPSEIDEGNSVEIIGTVENLTDDAWIQLLPVRIISEGQGVPRGPVEFDEGTLPPPGSFGLFNPLLPPTLEETEENASKQKFRIRVDTTRVPGLDWNIGRLPVLLTTAVGGEIRPADGEPRELTEDDFKVSFGKGKFENSSGTMIRAQVNPNPLKPRELTPDQFFLEMYGRGLENLALGGKEAVTSIPQLLYGIYQLGNSLVELRQSVDREKQIAAKNAYRLMWAWLDWQTEIYLELQNTQELEQELTALAEELHLYYGEKFESAEEIKNLIRDGIDAFFVKALAYKDRAYNSHDEAGLNEELAAILAEPAKPLGQALTEELLFAGVGAWFSRISKSSRVVNRVEHGRELFVARTTKQAKEATDEVRKSWLESPGNDPRLSPAPRSMRSLPAKTPVTALQALRGWAVDRVSDANLRQITKELPIIVAVRSRADETIQWLKETVEVAGKTITGVVLKPFKVKPKNVNYYDVNYLGYKDGVGYRKPNGNGGGDKGTVILAKPISRDEVLANLDLRDANEFTREQVLARHNKRWKEWYGVDFPDTTPPSGKLSQVDELKAVASNIDPETGTRYGYMDIPDKGQVPIPEDNLDTRGLPTRTVPRRFEMRRVADPNSPTPNNFEREYWEIWMEDSDGQMKRMSGDIDIVNVNKTDGSMLDPMSEETRNIATNLRDRVDAQHPWSSTLDIPNNPQVREDFLNDHRWHEDPAQRGEPLLLYVNGEAKVGWYDPTRNISMENPLDSMLWLDGSPSDIEDVIDLQKDLRNSLRDPREAAQPSYRTTETSLKTALEATDASNGTTYASCAIKTARTGGVVYRVGARMEIEKRDQSGNWVETNPENECVNSEIVVVPETAMAAADAGSLTLTILEESLGFDWKEMFAIGDEVLIGPDGPNPEVGYIDQHGSIILETPLQFSHPSGTKVVMTAAALDSDNDGVIDRFDAFPDDASEQYDADGDGQGDIADLDDDNDGFSDIDELQYHSDPTNASDTPDNHRPAQPLISALNDAGTGKINQWIIDVSGFNDPDVDDTNAKTEVYLSGDLDNDETGDIYAGTVSSLNPLSIPAAAIDAETEYQLYIRYTDSTGLTSAYAEPFLFTTPTNEVDANRNSIQDSLEIDGETDTNLNEVPDQDESIVAVIEPEQGLTVGLHASAGDVVNISTSDASQIMLPDNQALVVGILNFRVTSLAPGDTADVSLYVQPMLSSNAATVVYRENMASDARFIVATENIVIENKIVTVSAVDGGIHDLDGVQNGRIVLSLAIADQQTESEPAGEEAPTENSKKGGGGNMGLIVLVSLLILLMWNIWRQRLISRCHEYL